ncbi:MAG TPA: methyltransferase domain-containing protein [Stellaceae bacterium]|nr:methyltransferase domain-containing protein [Stellaceae bacterium]
MAPSRPRSEPVQHWDPERYRRNASFVAAGGAPVLELLAPQPGERILDLGCGEGALTALIAERTEVVGVDASAEQVASARARGLDARVMDAAALPFEHEFDAVFSNAALHWIKDLDAVVAGVRRALKPGGRFVAEMGGEGNVAIMREAMHRVFARHGVDVAAADPWRFLSVAEGRALLGRHGFAVRFIELIPRPTPLPGALGDWLDTFAETFLKRLPEAQRGPVKAEIEEHLKDRLRDPAGRWTADYVRLRFAAELASGT